MTRSRVGRDLHGTLQKAIRPTDGTGWMGNGYEKDAMVKSYDPARATTSASITP